MNITNYVDGLYIDLERCQVDQRSEGYIKDKIASAMRAAIFDSLQEQREMDPEAPNIRLECLKIAAYTAPKRAGDDRPEVEAVIGTAADYLQYVQTGDGIVSRETKKP